MSQPMPSHKRSRQQYVRLLKRRQHTSLWLERLAAAAVIAALVCFIAEQVVQAALVCSLGMGCLLIALLAVIIEAVDDALERHVRRQQQRVQDALHVEEHRTTHEATEGTHP